MSRLTRSAAASGSWLVSSASLRRILVPGSEVLVAQLLSATEVASQPVWCACQLSFWGWDRQERGCDAVLTLVSVGFVSSRQVLVPLNFLKVLAHVLGRPALVARLVDDDVPVVISRQGTHSRVVHGAPTQHSGARVLDSQQLGVLRGVQADVEGAVARVPGCVLELEVSLRVVRVLDPKVPSRQLVVGRLVEVGDVRVRRVLALVSAGLDQEGRVPGAREVGR